MLLAVLLEAARSGRSTSERFSVEPSNIVTRGRPNDSMGSPLVGKLFDETGERLTPSHERAMARSLPKTFALQIRSAKTEGGIARLRIAGDLLNLRTMGDLECSDRGDRRPDRGDALLASAEWLQRQRLRRCFLVSRSRNFYQETIYGDSSEWNLDRKSGICDRSGRRHRSCYCTGVCSRRSKRGGS